MPAPLSLTLLVPDLLWPGPSNGLPHPARDLSLPALSRLLSRSGQEPAPSADTDTTLFHLFGNHISGPPPVAAITLPEPQTGYWLRADPVHLRPDRDRLLLFDRRMFTLDQTGANRLAAEVNQWAAPCGWELRATTPYSWHLRLPTPPAIETTPLEAVTGRDILAHLPRGEQGSQWHALLNEVQMLLHQSSVNQQREADGQPAINSLWFWGGGSLPEVRPGQIEQAWSQNETVTGLAALAGTPHTEPPQSARQWLENIPSPRGNGNYLIVIESLREFLEFGEAEAWTRALQRFDSDWAAPLLAALQDGTLARLTLLPGNGRAFTLDRRRLRPLHPRNWLRRNHPYQYYARTTPCPPSPPI